MSKKVRLNIRHAKIKNEKQLFIIEINFLHFLKIIFKKKFFFLKILNILTFYDGWQILFFTFK